MPNAKRPSSGQAHASPRLARLYAVGLSFSPVGLWDGLGDGRTSNRCSVHMCWVEGLVSEIFHEAHGHGTESWKSGSSSHPSFFRGEDLRHLFNLKGG